MLKEGLLKENIDGESILWAFNRLKKRKEERKNYDGYFRWCTS